MAVLRLVTLVTLVVGLTHASDRVKIFNTKLDNNNPNSASYYLRYYEEKRWNNNGPAILYTNYLTAYYFAVPPIVRAIARKTGGTIFVLEHRCYNPRNPPSFSHKYCTSDQALMDYANFIRYQNQLLPRGTKWIVTGCSYPGRMALQMKALYPDLVHAAYGSGGPSVANIYNPEQIRLIALFFAKQCNGVSAQDVTRVLEAGKCTELVWDIAFYGGEHLKPEFCQMFHSGQCTEFERRVAQRIQNANTQVWSYQICEEFGWFWSGRERDWYKFCRHYWGSDWHVGALRTNIDRANQKMLQLLQNTNRTLEVQGTADFWSPNTFNISFPGVTRIDVPGAGHCDEMGHTDGPLATKILSTLTGWLEQ